MEDLSSLGSVALCTELTHERFRNPVISYARARLQEVLEANLNDAIETLYVKEWRQITSAVDIAQSKGISHEPRDSLDYLGVNHFPVLFEKYFSDLVPAESIPAGDAARMTRKKLTGWLGEVKDLRNPGSHATEDGIAVHDLLRTADSCVRVLRLLDLNDAIVAVEQIRQELLRRAVDIDDSQAELQSIMSTLPPKEEMFDEFVGRVEHLESLWAWYADDASKKWVLVGEGGKGKSAIAYQFARTIQAANPDQIAAVVWLSAKLRRFADSEVVEIGRPDFFDLDTALTRLLKDFGDTANLGKTLDAKRDVVLSLLSELPSLLVIDDIDSIDAENEEVVEFFTYDVPRTKSKVLLTSRRLYPGMAKSSTHVSGLARPEALEYYKLTMTRLGLNGRGDLDAAFDRIFEATEGSPLYMEDLLRLCRSLKTREAVDRWKQSRGDAARRYALQRECDLLSDAARGCLEACCWANSALSVAQFEVVLGIGQDQAVSAVQELESRFLVPTPEIVEGVPAYRAHRNLEVIVRQDIRHDPNKARLRNAVENVLRRVGGDEAVLTIARQVDVRVRSGRLTQALDVADRALEANPASPDLLAIRAEALASQRPPRMPDARQDWERAFDFGLARKDAFIHWVLLEHAASDWKRAYTAAERGMSRTTDDGELSQLAAYSASRCGQALTRGIDRETAHEWLVKAEKHARKALREYKLRKAGAYKVGRVYKVLIVNATFFEEEERKRQVTYWTLRWVDEFPDYPDALEQAERQAVRFPDVRRGLEQRGLR